MTRPVFYTIAAKLGGIGIGSIAQRAVEGLDRRNLLQRVICTRSAGRLSVRRRPVHLWPIWAAALGLRWNASYSASGAHGMLFDYCASKLLRDCKLYHGWNSQALRSIETVKGQGGVAVVQCASTHPVHELRVMRTEYDTFGVTTPLDIQLQLKRKLRELEICDYVLIPSEFVRRTFLDNGYPSEKLIVVPFGVDLDRFLPPGQVRVRPFRVVFVGQVCLRKGVQYLLQAWSRLSLPDAELVLAGELKADAKNVIREYAGRCKFRLTGLIGTVPDLMRSASVFVLPSLEEGSALVTYEAMAAGIPSIVTPNCGSLVRHSVDGFVVPARDPQAIADAIVSLYEQPELAVSMGREARAAVEDFSWGRHGDQLATCYAHLLGSSRGLTPEASGATRRRADA